MLLASCMTYDFGLKNWGEAHNRMLIYGYDDPEALRLYNLAITQLENDVKPNKSGIIKVDAYFFLVGILLNGTAVRNLPNGPISIRDYRKALMYSYDSIEYMESLKGFNAKVVKDIGGIARAYSDIGLALYRLGDYYSACVNWKKAAELSDICAGDEARMYWLGLGVEQDLPKAMELYKKAAIAGQDVWPNIYALEYQINEYNKGNFYSEAITSFYDYHYLYLMGEAKNVWMQSLTKSADLGFPPAQIDLWVYLRNDRQYSSGMPYLQKAIAIEYIPAFFHMGYVYQEGLGNTKNYREAQRYYEKAAVQGDPLAQNNLGLLYFNNNISTSGFTNQQMAYYWWNAAAEQGFAIAANNKSMIANYRPPMSNYEAAVQIANNLTNILNTSVNLYNSLNKSRINTNSYVPPSSRPQGTVQNNTNTVASTSGNTRTEQMCPMKCNRGECTYQGFGLNYCHGTGKIDCSECRGNGTVDGKLCRTCKGVKKVECGLCHGDGKCRRCNGTGRI